MRALSVFLQVHHIVHKRRRRPRPVVHVVEEPRPEVNGSNQIQNMDFFRWFGGLFLGFFGGDFEVVYLGFLRWFIWDFEVVYLRFFS